MAVSTLCLLQSRMSNTWKIMTDIGYENAQILEGLFKSFRDTVGTKNFQLPRLGHRFEDFANHFYYKEMITPKELIYLEKVVQHKIEVYNAGIELTKLPMFEILFTEGQKQQFIENLVQHDLSKFTYLEMYGYAHHDFNSKEEDDYFSHSWHHHKMNNPHHPEHWLSVDRGGKVTPLVMSTVYVFEMVADWIGAGKTYGNELKDWLPDNIGKFLFNEHILPVLDSLLTEYGIDTSNFNYKIN